MNGAMKPRKTMSRGYDLASIPLHRTGRLFFLSRFLPMGNMGGGPGWRCLLVLGIIRYCGGILFRAMIPFEASIHRLYQMRRKIGSIAVGGNGKGRG